MSTHVLDFQLQLVLCSLGCALEASSVPSGSPFESIGSYLEGEMFEEVSCAIRSVGLCSGSSINPYTHRRRLGPRRVFWSNLFPVSRCQAGQFDGGLTVKPLESVVVSVFTPFFTTGVAKPLRRGETTSRAARVRSPFERLSANRRDAMRAVELECEGKGWRRSWIESRGIAGIEGRFLRDFGWWCSSQSPTFR